jgi:hypothetical protein
MVKYVRPSCFGRFPFEIDVNQECEYCGCNDPAQVAKGKPDCREASRKFMRERAVQESPC